MSLTNSDEMLYTASNTASNTEANTAISETPGDGNSPSHEVAPAIGRDSAKKGETQGTELAGTLTKGAKAVSARLRADHKQRQIAHAKERLRLRKKAEHEWFVDRFGKFISKETGTIFVPDDLDFDPKRQDLEKNLAKDRPTDQVALARELLASIQSDLDDDDDPEASPTLIGLVAALTGKRVTSGRKKVA